MNLDVKVVRMRKTFEYCCALFRVLTCLLLMSLFFSGSAVANAEVVCQTMSQMPLKALQKPFLIDDRQVCFRQLDRGGLPGFQRPVPCGLFAWLSGALKDQGGGVVLPVKRQYELVDDYRWIEPSSQAMPDALLKSSLIPDDIPDGQYRRLAWKIEQVLASGQHRQRPAISALVHRAQVRVVISPELTLPDFSVSSFYEQYYEQYTDVLIQAYLSLLDDQALNEMLSEWGSATVVAAGGSGGGDDDDNGSNQHYIDSEPDPLVIIHGENVWPEQDSPQALLEKSLENKRRLLKVLRKKLLRAIASGNRDLINILDNRVMLIEVELRDLEASGDHSAPALLKASLVADDRELQHYDDLSLRQALTLYSVTNNALSENLIITADHSDLPQRHLYSHWLNTPSGLIYSELKRRLGRQLRVEPNNAIVINALVSRIEMLAGEFRSLATLVPFIQHGGSQMTDSDDEQKTNGKGSIALKTGTQTASGSGRSWTKTYRRFGKDDDGKGEPPHKSRHTKNNNCPLCNHGPCKEKESKTEKDDLHSSYSSKNEAEKIFHSRGNDDHGRAPESEGAIKEDRVFTVSLTKSQVRAALIREHNKLNPRQVKLNKGRWYLIAKALEVSLPGHSERIFSRQEIEIESRDKDKPSDEDVLSWFIKTEGAGWYIKRQKAFDENNISMALELIAKGVEFYQDHKFSIDSKESLKLFNILIQLYQQAHFEQREDALDELSKIIEKRIGLHNALYFALSSDNSLSNLRVILQYFTKARGFLLDNVFSEKYQEELNLLSLAIMEDKKAEAILMMVCLEDYPEASPEANIQAFLKTSLDYQAYQAYQDCQAYWGYHADQFYPGYQAYLKSTSERNPLHDSLMRAIKNKKNDLAILLINKGVHSVEALLSAHNTKSHDGEVIEKLLEKGYYLTYDIFHFGVERGLCEQDSVPEFLVRRYKEWAGKREKPIGKNTVLNLACELDNAELVKFIIDEMGEGVISEIINVGIDKEGGKTPLLISVWNGNIEIRDMLIQAGAALNLDKYGYDMLRATIRYDDLAFFKTLIAEGVEVGLLRSEGGLIKVANCCGSTKLFEYLLQSEASKELFFPYRDILESRYIPEPSPETVRRHVKLIMKYRPDISPPDNLESRIQLYKEKYPRFFPLPLEKTGTSATTRTHYDSSSSLVPSFVSSFIACNWAASCDGECFGSGFSDFCGGRDEDEGDVEVVIEQPGNNDRD